MSGPFFFCVYVSDSVGAMPHGVQVKLFADDVKIYSSDPAALQLALDRLLGWARTWQLQVADAKTFVLHIGMLACF